MSFSGPKHPDILWFFFAHTLGIIMDYELWIMNAALSMRNYQCAK